VGRRDDAGEKQDQGHLLVSITGRDAMLVLLSLAAGCVDAVSYLGLNNVFTANMTGNTVLLGLAIGQAKPQAALRSGVALAGFVVGVAAGAAIVERGREDVAWPSVVTAALALECVVLVAFAVGWRLAGALPGEAVYSLIALSAFAMGVQSAAVSRLGVASVSTTYITGTLTSLMRRLVGRVRSTSSSTAGDSTHESPSARDLELPPYVWFASGVGAVIGGAAELWWESAAILLPLAIVTVVVATVTIRYQRR
jgi:uncharacterized membrane protein YoaK (UPF0700 family)